MSFRFLLTHFLTLCTLFFEPTSIECFGSPAVLLKDWSIIKIFQVLEASCCCFSVIWYSLAGLIALQIQNPQLLHPHQNIWEDVHIRNAIILDVQAADGRIYQVFQILSTIEANLVLCNC